MSTNILTGDLQIYPSVLDVLEVGKTVKINDEYFKVSELSLGEKLAVELQWQSRKYIPEGMEFPCLTLEQGVLSLA